MPAGHVFAEHGICTNFSKIEIVRSWPEPRNKDVFWIHRVL